MKQEASQLVQLQWEASDIDEFLPVVTRKKGHNLNMSLWRCNQLVNKQAVNVSHNNLSKHLII